MDHPALFTDLYQLTMAQAYLQSGTTGSATFSLYFRSYPPDRAYYVLGGVDDALEYLESLRFTGEDLAYLKSLDLFDGGFLDYLANLRFRGDVRAMKEGSVFFAGEPVMEVTAPIIEGQIVETCLLNQINLQTILATKASRVVHAGRGRTIVDFAARRTQGAEASNKLAHAAYMVGFAGTSNVLAGKMYGIPVFGTMAHSFIEAFESEEQALRAYARSFPDDSTFLVDTYDTLAGVEKAASVASALASEGHSLQAVRLDSGDLLDLATRSRSLLDRAGLPGVRIFASGGLDEFEVDRLLSAGAPIDGFGVGTKVGVSQDAPSSDCTYKLVEYDGRPTLKLSTDKATLPAPKQVYRFVDQHGRCEHDVIALASEAPPPGGDPMLSEAMVEGGRTASREPLEETRKRFESEFARVPQELKALRPTREYTVETSEELARLARSVTDQVKARELT